MLSGTISAREAGHVLSDLAEELLEATCRLVCERFSAAHGNISGGRFILLALGRLGAREMTVTSDLDLILLYDHAADAGGSNGKRPLAPAEYYTKLTQRLLAAVSAPTSEGVLYEMDFRLRPSGNAGPLATRFLSFRRYQSEQAWTWEHMAMTRGRCITGNAELAKIVCWRNCKYCPPAERSGENTQ